MKVNSQSDNSIPETIRLAAEPEEQELTLQCRKTPRALVLKSEDVLRVLCRGINERTVQQFIRLSVSEEVRGDLIQVFAENPMRPLRSLHGLLRIEDRKKPVVAREDQNVRFEASKPLASLIATKKVVGGNVFGWLAEAARS